MGHKAGALVPVDEKTIEFYGDELQGVIVTITPPEQAILVLVRPMCDF
jgi:hypothetical protein